MWCTEQVNGFICSIGTRRTSEGFVRPQGKRSSIVTGVADPMGSASIAIARQARIGRLLHHEGLAGRITANLDGVVVDKAIKFPMRKL